MDFLNKLMAKLGLGKNTTEQPAQNSQPAQPAQTEQTPQA